MTRTFNYTKIKQQSLWIRTWFFDRLENASCVETCIRAQLVLEVSPASRRNFESCRKDLINKGL